MSSHTFNEVWDASRLDDKLVDYYLEHAKKLWPMNAQLKYSEDIALHFLCLKSYNIEEAIVSFIYDKCQVHRLIEVHCHERIDMGKLKLEMETTNIKQPSERELRTRMIKRNLINWI